jgi:ubiquinone/menaquinone biosynthesis C-methylase UbiE
MEDERRGEPGSQQQLPSSFHQRPFCLKLCGFCLHHRQRLAYRWIPAATERLLDAGCGSGNCTRHYVHKARETWGIDPDEAGIVAARRKYPEIHFEQSHLENLPFENRFFDVVTLTDVLEHVQDEVAAMNEIYRVTRAGATVIITTPHTGLFSWLDTNNYGFFLRTHLPRIYRFFTLVGLAQGSTEIGPKHRHYSFSDLERILQKSDFVSDYTVTNIFRSGCFFNPLGGFVFDALGRLFPERIAEMLTIPFRWLGELDYWIPYGSIACSIGVCIRRK